jgi:NAD(P)H-hydrate epimerase
MKIFSAAQIRACDAYTIHASRIRSLELMERAAARCTDWLTANFSRQCSFIVLCGTGNNGGDGLAVSRMLHHLGYAVKAFTLSVSPVVSEDCAANLQRLTDVDPGLVIPVGQDTFLTDVPGDVVIIDAIFGTGLNRPPEGWIADFIHHINQLPNQKVAIDIPSGMPADTIAPAPAAIVRADHTLSFQFYKRAFLHPETGVFAGRVHILDIGLDATFIQATHTNYQIIDTATVREFYKPLDP